MKINYIDEYQKGHKFLRILQLLSLPVFVVWSIFTLASSLDSPTETGKVIFGVLFLLGIVGYPLLILIFKAIKAAFVARDIQIETFYKLQKHDSAADKAAGFFVNMQPVADKSPAEPDESAKH